MRTSAVDVNIHLRPEEGQSIWSKRWQGFQPCFEAGIRELPFLMPEPAEKPSLHYFLLTELYSKVANCSLCVQTLVADI